MYLGVDISTKTGYAVVDKGEVISYGVVTTKKEKGMARVQYILDQIMSIIHRYDPKLIVIEGYGFANKHSLVTLVEIGTILRYYLYQEGLLWLEVTPNSLKKFVTGKGSGKKEVIIKEVYRRFGFDTDNNDIADAVGLAYLGAALDGYPVKLPKQNLTVLDTVRDQSKVSRR